MGYASDMTETTQPTPNDAGVLRPLTSVDLPRAVEIQSTAFANDPFWLLLLPNERRRNTFRTRFFRAFLSLYIANGQAYGVGNPLEGIVVWSKPNQREPGFSTFLQSGFISLFLSPILFSFPRIARVFGKFAAMQKQYAPDPHYYLNTISVLPQAQGKGLASKLIKPFLEQADREGVGAYTETSTPSNVSLYEHYGFQVMEAYRLPNADLTLWGFYRVPQKREPVVSS